MPQQTPSGLRDTMPAEWLCKEDLKNTLLALLCQAGCQPISTPALEYYQTYAQAFEDTSDREMFKCVDQHGDILVLRMDMTVPIARAASTKFAPGQPLALCYCEDVFKVRHTFAGRRSQVTDCGAEFIGYGPEADLDVLKLAASVLEAAAPARWNLEISDIRLFEAAAEATGLDTTQKKELASLVNEKCLPDLEVWLNRHAIANTGFFMALPLLSGGLDVLDAARNLCFTPEMEAILDRLESLYCQLDDPDHITIDLSKTPHLNYYTSLIFEGFALGTGFSVLSGGRYDRLLAKFGPARPAIGFSVKLDHLLEAQA